MSVEIIEGADTRIDRLFRLLPLVHQMRDAEQGHVLRALLRVIAEQVNLVEDDIARLYDNWFIETAEDWAVPYIADLVGYRPAAAAERTPDRAGGAAGHALERVLVPRREAAGTIRYRRGKGRLALLEELARDVAGWPAHAVEYFKLLGWHQNLDHPHPGRARLADLRDMRALDRIGGPFDRMAHGVDIRRIASNRTAGRHNIPSVGVFVWRLRAYPVTYAPANCAESAGAHCYTFSVLGNDAPLFRRPAAARDADCARTPDEAERGMPAPIGRRALEQDLDRLYGEGRSLAIWAEGWGGRAGGAPVPAGAIVAADLTGWRYVPPRGRIAVDPVLGRIAFPPGQLPRKGVRVSYHYGFSADMGGGEYRRTLYDPVPRAPRAGDAPVPPVLYRVGRTGDYQRLWDALKAWREQGPADAVIELVDSGVYAEPFLAELGPGQTLQMRAAQGARPVLRLLDWQTDLPDAFSVVLARASRFTLDGIVVTGRGLRIGGALEDEAPDAPHAPAPTDARRGDVDADHDRDPGCGAALTIRHCTLVPGWGLGPHCEPMRPAEPSLELTRVDARVRIEHSILGSVQVDADQVRSDPIALCVADSIIDAAAPDKEAIGAPGNGIAHVRLTVLRSTVFGTVEVHAVELAEDSIFDDCVHVARRQIGCMRFCYVQPQCRTPRRYRCQPDLALAALQDALPPAGERLRVRPQFTSAWYGNPGYGQLGAACAREIRSGAEDESEMGAFHDLFQPQREANLRARLEEFTPAGVDVAIIRAT